MKIHSSIWLLGIICNCFIFFSCEKQNHRKPNIVFLLADDLGYNELGAYGQKIIKTPNLDKLHSESLRFTDFHVSPFCSPTRAQLLTGRYPQRTGVWHSIKGRSLIHRDEITSADIFKKNG